jgi:hypothetical protein
MKVIGLGSPDDVRVRFDASEIDVLVDVLSSSEFEAGRVDRRVCDDRAGNAEQVPVIRVARRGRRAREERLVAGGMAALLVAMTWAVSAVSGGRSASASAAARPVAVVYRGPASCSGCSEAVAALIRRSPLRFSVSYIGPRERRKLSAAGLRGVALYAQPGGGQSVGRAMRALGRQGARAIERFVAAGGHYVGFCMGAYLAGSDPGMGLLSPGDTGEYDQTRGASVRTAAEAVIPVRWAGSRHDEYAQDPPYMIASGVRGERVLSRYTNGEINALVRPYHRGRVGVVGTHPEADRTWYTARLWRADKDGLDYAQGLQLIAAVMSSSR